jgi:L-asparaginase
VTRVLLIATGDTIAYGHRAGAPVVLTGADLLAALPARPGAHVDTEDVSAEPSWDTSPATMLALARRVRSAVLDDGYDGVVVTHGTDTVEETAFLADLLAGPAAARAGIVFTGALRPAAEYRVWAGAALPHRRGAGPEPSAAADGPRNLAAALAAAADPALRAAGAVVCADDELHAARWVSTADVTGAGPALSSAPHPPLFHVTAGGRVEPAGAPPPRPPDPPGEPATDVALIKTYPGMDGTLLTAAVDAGAAGIVLEGTGAGNVPAGLLATISDLTEWKIPVVVASRCRTGGRDLADLGLGATMAAAVGAIGARGLPAPKARIALMVALGTGSAAGARRWFGEL